MVPFFQLMLLSEALHWGESLSGWVIVVVGDEPRKRSLAEPVPKKNCRPGRQAEPALAYLVNA
jgi:hypothetical protein